MGLVSWQWDVVDWTCVLCEHRIHNDQVSRLASSRQCACPFCSSCAGFFLAKHHITQVFWLFPKLKSTLKGRRFVYVTVTQYRLSQRRLTADWLAPQESDRLQMNSKVSSDWLPSHIKAMRPVLEIFKMDRYFLDSPLIGWGVLFWALFFTKSDIHLQVYVNLGYCSTDILTLKAFIEYLDVCMRQIQRFLRVTARHKHNLQTQVASVTVLQKGLHCDGIKLYKQAPVFNC